MRFMDFTQAELDVLHDGLMRERELDPDEDPSFPPIVEAAEAMLAEIGQAAVLRAAVALTSTDEEIAASNARADAGPEGTLIVRFNCEQAEPPLSFSASLRLPNGRVPVAGESVTPDFDTPGFPVGLYDVLRVHWLVGTVEPRVTCWLKMRS